jgi:5-enolpyruvylshikimate-3-phosphate synthase
MNLTTPPRVEAVLSPVAAPHDKSETQRVIVGAALRGRPIVR